MPTGTSLLRPAALIEDRTTPQKQVWRAKIIV